MGIKAGKKYNGVVIGGQLMESGTGSLGYQVFLNCDDGETSYTIWLTAKNKERAEETFEKVLGVDPANLANANYIENQLANDIMDHPVTFTTVEEEYNGKTKVKVGFLNKRSASNGGSLSKAAAALFADGDFQAVEDDIPF